MEDLSYINESLRSLAVPIDSIVPDPANERIHDEKNMAAIKGSIARFGQHQVVTVWQEKGIIIAGNGRWKAMKELGYNFIAANVKSYTEIEAAALRVADNRTSELASWDYNLLGETMKALQSSGYTQDEFDSLGWSEDELRPLLQSTWTPITEPGDDKSNDESDKDSNTIKVVFSMEQWETVQRAIVKAKGASPSSDGEATLLTLIAAAYLSA